MEGPSEKRGAEKPDVQAEDNHEDARLPLQSESRSDFGGGIFASKGKSIARSTESCPANTNAHVKEENDLLSGSESKPPPKRGKQFGGSRKGVDGTPNANRFFDRKSRTSYRKTAPSRHRLKLAVEENVDMIKAGHVPLNNPAQLKPVEPAQEPPQPRPPVVVKEQKTQLQRENEEFEKDLGGHDELLVQSVEETIVFDDFVEIVTHLGLSGFGFQSRELAFVPNGIFHHRAQSRKAVGDAEFKVAKMVGGNNYLANQLLRNLPLLNLRPSDVLSTVTLPFTSPLSTIAFSTVALGLLKGQLTSVASRATFAFYPLVTLAMAAVTKFVSPKVRELISNECGWVFVGAIGPLTPTKRMAHDMNSKTAARHFTDYVLLYDYEHVDHYGELQTMRRHVSLELLTQGLAHSLSNLDLTTENCRVRLTGFFSSYPSLNYDRYRYNAEQIFNNTLDLLVHLHRWRCVERDSLKLSLN